MDEQLNAYVKENIKAGYTSEQLRTALLSQGWDATDVDVALVQAASAPSPPPAVLQKEIPAVSAPPTVPTSSKISPSVAARDPITEKRKMPLWQHALIIAGIVLVLCGIGGILYYFFLMPT